MKYKAVEFSILLERIKETAQIINLKILIHFLLQKLDGVYQSKDLITEFPALKACGPINLGVIMCWVHDATNESYFECEFEKYLNSIRIVTMPKPLAYKRILVLNNLRIL